MQLRASCALLAALWVVAPFGPSDGLQTTVRPNKGSAVLVSTSLPLDQCAVCTLSGVNDTQTSCHSSLSLTPDEEVKLLFNCSEAVEQAFDVTITQAIECTNDQCSPTTGETQTLLSEFTRTFVWNLKAPVKTALGVNVLGDGFLERPQPELCPDGFRYSVITILPVGQEDTQDYCRGGSLTHLELSNQATVVLQAQPQSQVTPVLFHASAGPIKGRKMAVSIGPDATVVMTRNPKEAECDVCQGDGSNPKCSPTGVTLNIAEEAKLEFSCPKPEEVYTVKVVRKIGCTQSACTPATGEVDPTFNGFKQSLVWDIGVPERTVLALDFPGAGLKEMSGSDKCLDAPLYTLSTTSSEGAIKTKTYCGKGTVSHLNLLGKTVMTVEVPKDADLDSTVFTAKAAPRKGRLMFVTPDPNTNVVIQRDTTEPDCSVCVDKDSKKICNPRYLALRDALNTSVDFTCANPQDYFTVEINREIDCTNSECAGNIDQPEASLFPDFDRTFIWDLKAPPSSSFQLDFPTAGWRQIANGDSCPDEQTYSVISYLRTGPATVGTFCSGGRITTVSVLYKGRMLLRVPGGRMLQPIDVRLSPGQQTNMVSTVRVNLPRGVSETELTSANYPNDFPDNQQAKWEFIVPGMHNYSVHFRDYTAPECLKREMKVEYQKPAKTRMALTDPQPEHQQGNFNMVLWNCETNRSMQGLSLKFTVSVMRSGHPVLCSVDLSKQDGVSLQIKQVGLDPYCEMTLNSDVKKTIKVAAGTKAQLSFLDCPHEDIHLTANQVIGCQNLNSCAVMDTQLIVPELASCLPTHLRSFTWDLNIPEDGTVNLEAPVGSLRQSVPGQECSDGLALRLAKASGSALGDFCYDGVIQKVQIRSNASVTATVRNFTENRGPFVNVSFTYEISENIIYRVSPTESSPAMLATPNWPEGMQPFSTVSWIVTLPSQYQATVQFVNISQPKCDQRHTYIKVQTLGSEEEMFSRREDEEAEDKLMVPGSFYLNMSNCLTQEGHFGAVTKVVLERKTNVLAIVLGIIGGLLLLTLLAVALVFMKKKKAAKNKDASIYIGKGNVFLPGDSHFSKSRKDNDSHVYASIDETMIYGHLLDGTSHSGSTHDSFKGMQVDSYQTFMGPTDSQLPVIKEPESESYMPFLDPAESFLPPRPRTPIDRQDSLGFQDRRMVDNELYTFKSTGEMNTIRLSDADMEPQPPVYLETEEL